MSFPENTKPGIATATICQMELPVIAELSDGCFLVAHPNGVGIGTEDCLYCLDAPDVSESLRSRAMDAFEKFAWPLVRDQFFMEIETSVARTQTSRKEPGARPETLADLSQAIH